MTSRESRYAALVLAAAAAFAGCAEQPKAKPLTPEAFISPRASTPAAPAAVTPAPRPDPVAPPPNTVASQIDNALNKPANPGANAPRPTALDVTPAPPATTTRTTIGASGGQYMTLGGVVAEVNSTPIHASKVLTLLDPVFRRKARQMNRDQFKREATDDIRKQIGELIRLELDYAAAQRSLDPDDRRLADGLTIMWRIQQITNAGGSLELARRASMQPADPEAAPMDFDERTAERQRAEMIRIYNQKKLIPRIQVSANDIREYYDRNVNLKFTQNERVKFRLIKVDFAKTGSKDKAADKMADKYKRTVAGEDFTAMARKENDEKLFAGDAPFDVAPSSFAITKVADALKGLNPGDVSKPIDDRDGYYLVKLESRTGGRTRPFEEQAVQDEIRQALRAEQYARLREQDFARLMSKSAITSTEQMASIALDMAMQRYNEYAGK